jgi:hypothetical protein
MRKKIVGGLIVFLALIVCTQYYKHKTTEVTITVTDKTNVLDKNTQEMKYLIFTDKGVFENTDSFLHWKFNSSDIYGQLKKDSTYTVTVEGFRVPFLSWYKNIIEIK